MPRFPTRTLVLMALTLVAFGWFWWQTHQAQQPKRRMPAPDKLDQNWKTLHEDEPLTIVPVRVAPSGGDQ